MISYTLTDKQQQRLDEWVSDLYREIMEKQAAGGLDWIVPYYGAAGGGLTYKFTPTGLGLVIEVTEYHTQKTINLTDYSDW